MNKFLFGGLFDDTSSNIVIADTSVRLIYTPLDVLYKLVWFKQ